MVGWVRLVVLEFCPGEVSNYVYVVQVHVYGLCKPKHMLNVFTKNNT